MLIKSKSLISGVASKLDFSDELVNDVVDFYYEELRKNMENLSENRLYVPKIGIFYISEKKIKNSIETLTHILNTKKPETFKQIGIYNHKQNLLFEQEKVYQRLLKQRKEYERKKDLGSKKSNP
jgi:hypothetical protein